jgi:hypothetical protein
MILTGVFFDPSANERRDKKVVVGGRRRHGVGRTVGYEARGSRKRSGSGAGCVITHPL